LARKRVAALDHPQWWGLDYLWTTKRIGVLWTTKSITSLL